MGARPSLTRDRVSLQQRQHRYFLRPETCRRRLAADLNRVDDEATAKVGARDGRVDIGFAADSRRVSQSRGDLLDRGAQRALCLSSALSKPPDPLRKRAMSTVPAQVRKSLAVMSAPVISLR